MRFFFLNSEQVQFKPYVLGCYVKGGSGKPTQMTYGCPCSTGLQCIGSGHYDIPLGEIGNTQAIGHAMSM